MNEYVNVALLNHAVEASALSAALECRQIPHQLQSYYDSAYDGMFQLQHGWGCVLAPPELGAEIGGILEELRAGAALTEADGGE